jgi:hypothetical protein
MTDALIQAGAGVAITGRERSRAEAAAADDERIIAASFETWLAQR